MKTEDFDTVAKLKRGISEIRNPCFKKNIVLKGLIIDIRNNTGGYLDLSISLADLFLSKGVIGTMNIANKTKEDFFAKVPAITNLPIGIMVNSRTSSEQNYLQEVFRIIRGQFFWEKERSELELFKII